MQGLLTLLKGKRAFLWDFDGCLCDSERAHFLAYNKAFCKYGHQVEEAKYYASFTHRGNGTEREIAEYELACSVLDIAMLKNLFYKEIIESNAIGLFKETPAIVERLKTFGAKIAIASNSPFVELQSILQNNMFEDKIDLVVGKTPELQKKPAPNIFLHTMKLLNIAPQEALVFEDTERGLEAAKRAGCDAIWIRAWHNKELCVTQPHLAELSHGQLLELLQSQ